MAWDRKAITAYLVDVDTGDYLDFQYNPNDIADDDNGRSFKFLGFRALNYGGKRADDGHLVRGRAPSDKGDRRVRRFAVRQKLTGNTAQVFHAHEEHQFSDAFGQCGPVDA